MAIFAPPLRRTLQELRDDPEERVWRRDIRSTGWDGGTDLSSVDTAATKGYFVDFSADAAQFETLFYKGAAIGVWAAWTPTYTNLTLGNGVLTARYATGLGDTIHAYFHLLFGSTTSIDGTAPTISMPVTARTGYVSTDKLGTATLHDTGTVSFVGAVRVGSTTTFVVDALDITSTFLTVESITASVPMTWTTNDVLAFEATYEAA